MQQNQRAAVLLAIVLFCTGVGVGVLWHRYYASTVSAKATSEDFRHRYISEMRSKLNLSRPQVDELNAILDDTKAKYRAARESVHPAMVKIKEDQTSRVKAILTASQIPIYEQMVAEHERKAREQEQRERQEDLKNAAAHRAQAVSH